MSRRLACIFQSGHWLKSTNLDAINRRTTAAILGLLLCRVPLVAQTVNYPGLQLNTGKQIYQAACVACHGSNGKGTPQSIAGFQKPDSFPDFTRCDQTTAEMDSDWKAVVVHGGPFRGFSQIMPAFGEALSDNQINTVIQYLRGFCENPHWPRAELNLPRGLITEKAYPEDEVAITTAFNAQGAPGVSTDVVYEQRFGVKNEVEVTVPFTFQDQNHTWYGSFGDSPWGSSANCFRVCGVARFLASMARSGSRPTGQ